MGKLRNSGANIVAPEWARVTIGLRKHVDVWFDPKEKKVLVVQFPKILAGNSNS